MSFLFVDRILSLDLGKKITGLKYVTATDVYWQQTRSQQKAFLPSIIGETLGQLAAWNVMKALDFRYRPVAGVVGSVIVGQEVHLGDTLYLSAHIEKLDESSVVYCGEVTVNGQMVLRLQHALGPMLKMETLCSRSQAVAQLDEIYRPTDIWEPCPGTAVSLMPTVLPIAFNKIENIENIEAVVAHLFVSRTAPYFPDHFPLKPVLPLTILLSAKVDLAFRILRHHFPQKIVKLSELRKIKMSEFVLPGDVLSTQVSLKILEEKNIVFTFRSTVANKRVCVCEAVFSLEC